MAKRRMTRDEINAMVRIKEDALHYVSDNMGIWGSPFASCNTELKNWREIQSGRIPAPLVDEDFDIRR